MVAASLWDSIGLKKKLTTYVIVVYQYPKVQTHTRNFIMQGICRTPFFECCASVLYDSVFDSMHLCFRTNNSGGAIADACVAGEQPCTWKVADAEFVCLIKTADNKTLVFNERYNAMYCTQCDFVLPREVPPMTVFMGQFVVDHVGTAKQIPRILVFDMVYDGGQFIGELPCLSRYERLRRFSGLLADTLIHVQWVGHTMRPMQLSALQKNLPHKIDKMLMLPAIVPSEQSPSLLFHEYSISYTQAVMG